MKTLTYNGEQFQAEKIVKTTTDIIGSIGDAEVFRLKGITDFSLLNLGEGEDWDIEEVPITIDELALLLTDSQIQLAEKGILLDQALLLLTDLQLQMMKGGN